MLDGVRLALDMELQQLIMETAADEVVNLVKDLSASRLIITTILTTKHNNLWF
jgi:hypothetical protein